MFCSKTIIFITIVLWVLGYYFHFSGHSGQKRDVDGIYETGAEETILPVDCKISGAISAFALYNLIVRDLPDGVKLGVSLDCCHPSRPLDLPFTLELQEGVGSGTFGRWRETLNPQFCVADVQVLSNARREDANLAKPWRHTSQGGFKMNAKNGALTSALAAALEGHKSGEDVSYAKLLKNAELWLGENGYKQKIQFSSSQKFNLSKKEHKFWRPDTNVGVVANF